MRGWRRRDRDRQGPARDTGREHVQEDQSLKDAAIARLTYRYTPDEDHARRRPPYPEPPVVQRLDAILAAAVHALPDVPEDSGPMVAGAVRGLAGLLGWRLRHAGTRSPVLLLIASGALDLNEAMEIAAAVDQPTATQVRRQVLMNQVAVGDLDAAVATAASLGEASWRGYRDIGTQLAMAGDRDGFFRFWPDYAAATEKAEMVRIKEILIAGVAAAHGWATALATCRERRIGPGFHSFAFDPLAEAGRVDELLGLFAGPTGDEVDECTQLQVLVRAITRDSPKVPEHDHPRLVEILDRVIALDHTETKTMRARDTMLLNLWPAFGEQATLDRARKAARAPLTKRDIGNVLPRHL